MRIIRYRIPAAWYIDREIQRRGHESGGPRCGLQRPDRRCFWGGETPLDFQDGDHWHQEVA